MMASTVGTTDSGTDSSSNATLQNETREQSQRLLQSLLLEEEAVARVHEELTTNSSSDQKTTKQQSQEEYDLLASHFCSSSSQDENAPSGASSSARATPILMEKDEDDDLEDESSETKDYRTHHSEEDVNDVDATPRAAQQQQLEESSEDETLVQDRCALLRNASRWDSRLKIAEWCYKVIDHHRNSQIPRDTVYLAMKLFDQVMDCFYERHNYHHQEEDSRRFLQLTSLACLYLGVKVYYFFSISGSSNSQECSSTSLTTQSLKRSMAQGDAVVLEGNETAPSLVEQFSSQECPILSLNYLLRHCSSDPSIKIEHLRRMETFVTKQTVFREEGEAQMPTILSSTTRMPLPTPGQFVKLILRSIDWSSSSSMLPLTQPSAAHDGVDHQVASVQQLKEDIYQHSLYLCELATCDHYFSSSYHHRSSSNKSESSNSSRNAIVLASDVALSAVIVSGDLLFRNARRTTTNSPSSSSSFMLLLLKPLLEQSFSLTKTKKRHLRFVCQRLLELNDNSSSGILIERRHPQGYSASASATENHTLVEDEHPPSENETMAATNDSTTSFPHVISSCGAED